MYAISRCLTAMKRWPYIVNLYQEISDNRSFIKTQISSIEFIFHVILLTPPASVVNTVEYTNFSTILNISPYI
jgi:hypothetical protein